MEKAKTEKRIVRAEDGNKNRKQMGDSREDKFVGWKGKGKHESTVGQVNQKPRRKYWATRSSIHSFARTAHSFACFRLLASLAPSAALIRSHHSLHSLPRSWDNKFLDGYFVCFFPFSTIVRLWKCGDEAIKVGHSKIRRYFHLSVALLLH